MVKVLKFMNERDINKLAKKKKQTPTLLDQPKCKNLEKNFVFVGVSGRSIPALLMGV